MRVRLEHPHKNTKRNETKRIEKIWFDQCETTAAAAAAAANTNL